LMFTIYRLKKEGESVSGCREKVQAG